MTIYNKKDIPEHLQKYFEPAEMGLEKTPEEYVAKIVAVFSEVRRVLKDAGTLWLNLGDSYATGGNGGGTEKQDSNRGTIALKGHAKKAPPGLKPKDLCGIPWRVAFALQSDGWYLRQDIIWHKPNPMPESVTDRCAKSHEYIFLLTKNQKYYFDNEAIKETSNWAGDPRAGYGRLHYRGKREGNSGEGQENFVQITEQRNKRSVWTVTTKPFKGAHFATFPEDLILPCVLAGCTQGGVILDPFMGAGTTGVVAKKNNRNFIGIELNPKYLEMAQQRIDNTMGILF